MSKLEIFLELMQIVERGFVYKLRQKTPNITEKEIQRKIKEWYLDQPMLSQSISQEADISRVM